jgi:hypothetical protein
MYQFEKLAIKLFKMYQFEKLVIIIVKIYQFEKLWQIEEDAEDDGWHHVSHHSLPRLKTHRKRRFENTSKTTL